MKRNQKGSAQTMTSKLNMIKPQVILQQAKPQRNVSYALSIMALNPTSIQVDTQVIELPGEWGKTWNCMSTAKRKL